MKDNRGYNARRNFTSGVFLRIILMLFPFINRTLILYILGAEYQGLSSLFAAILQVLNLADLGFSSAIIFSLYKPIAENDIITINALLAYLKKAYKIVGIIILLIGLILMPVLPHLIKGSYPKEINLYSLYFIYLFDAGISYLLFAYKNSLLIAEQRIDIVNNVSAITTVSRYVLQFLMLIITKNYYYYIIVFPFFTIINNIVIHHYSKKLYGEIKPGGKLNINVQKELNKQLKGIIIGKVCNVTRNTLDSVILSSLSGLTIVAIYNNYYYIHSTIYGFILIFAHALQAGIGDSIATESIKKNYDDINKFTFVSNWLSSVGSVCLLCLYQPFMKIWVGDKLILNNFNMILFCVYFYAINMTNIRNMYLSGCGIWYENRYWAIIEAIANLSLNIILGIIWGVSGVIIATIITIIVFNYIARTNVLFRCYFKFSPLQFFKTQLVYALINILIGFLLYYICTYIQIIGINGLLIKLIFCFLLSNILYIAIFKRYKYFDDSISLILKSLRKR